MTAKQVFLGYKSLFRCALRTDSLPQMCAATDRLRQALRSKTVRGQRARRLRAMARALEQKLSPVV